jgi:hypothetical protein
MTDKKIVYPPIIVQMPVPRAGLWLARQRKQSNGHTDPQLGKDPAPAVPSPNPKEAPDA